LCNAVAFSTLLHDKGIHSLSLARAYLDFEIKQTMTAMATPITRTLIVTPTPMYSSKYLFEALLAGSRVDD